jgi:hypothetical protein
MPSKRKAVAVDKLERKLEKTQRRIQKMSEQAYILRMTIAQLKDELKPYETRAEAISETVEK